MATHEWEDLASRIDPVGMACAFHQYQPVKPHKWWTPRRDLLEKYPLSLIPRWVKAREVRAGDRIMVDGEEPINRDYLNLDSALKVGFPIVFGAYSWRESRSRESRRREQRSAYGVQQPSRFGNLLGAAIGPAIAGSIAYAWATSGREHNRVVATFVDRRVNQVEGRILIGLLDGDGFESWAEQGAGNSHVELHPGDRVSKITINEYSEHKLRRCKDDECDSELVAAALAAILGELWNTSMREPPDVFVDEGSLVEALAWAHARDRLERALAISKAFGLINIDDEAIVLSHAGSVWLLAHARLTGTELLEDALPSDRRKYEVNIHGPITGSNVAFGDVKQQEIHQHPFNTEEREAILSLADLIESLQEDDAADTTKGQELSVIVTALKEEAASAEPNMSRLRTIARTISTVCVDLIVGAGGNGVWEAFKAITAG